ELAEIPAVADDAVIARKLPRQHRRLSRAGHRGQHGGELRREAVASERRQIRRLGPEHPPRETHHIEEEDRLHGSLCAPPVASAGARSVHLSITPVRSRRRTWWRKRISSKGRRRCSARDEASAGTSRAHESWTLPTRTAASEIFRHAASGSSNSTAWWQASRQRPRCRSTIAGSTPRRRAARRR